MVRILSVVVAVLVLVGNLTACIAAIGLGVGSYSATLLEETKYHRIVPLNGRNKKNLEVEFVKNIDRGSSFISGSCGIYSNSDNGEYRMKCGTIDVFMRISFDNDNMRIETENRRGENVTKSPIEKAVDELNR